MPEKTGLPSTDYAASLTARSSGRAMVVGSFSVIHVLRRHGPSLSLDSSGGFAFLMLFARVSAIIFLLQGVASASIFAAVRPRGWLLVFAAGLSAIISWGLWNVKPWAWRTAFIFTAPQLIVVGSPLFSWQFYTAANIGLGFTAADPPLRMDVLDFVWHSHLYVSYGARIDFSLLHPSPPLLALFPGLRSDSFFFVNVIAAALLLLLWTVRDKFPRTQ